MVRGAVDITALRGRMLEPLLEEVAVLAGLLVLPVDGRELLLGCVLAGLLLEGELLPDGF